MSVKNIQIASMARGAGLALVAALALSATPASSAGTASGSTLSIAQAATSTDISAARRHRQARRSASRNAFGSIGSSESFNSSGNTGFGYGVGDNSRGQTW